MANTKIKPIRAEKDYEELLARIDAFMDAVPGSPELDVLTDLVELYESRHGPMGYPSPLAEIQFRMEQGDLRPRDLIPFTGSRAKVSEVLSGKRATTMSMAHALHKHLGIPADVLMREPDVDLDDPHGRDGYGPPTAQVRRVIVAGKIRYERQNYRLLSQFVGVGEVQRQLGMKV